MRANKFYSLQFISGIPYLLPYGQLVADRARGITLNETGVFIWQNLEYGIENEKELIDACLKHYEVSESDRISVTQDIREFIDNLVQLRVIVNAPSSPCPEIFSRISDFTPSSAAISGQLMSASFDSNYSAKNHCLNIAGLNINVKAPEGTFANEFTPFEVSADKAGRCDMNIEIYTGIVPIFSPIGSNPVIISNELEIYEATDGYFFKFPGSPRISLAVMDKDGCHVYIYCHQPNDHDLSEDDGPDVYEQLRKYKEFVRSNPPKTGSGTSGISAASRPGALNVFGLPGTANASSKGNFGMPGTTNTSSKGNFSMPGTANTSSKSKSGMPDTANSSNGSAGNFVFPPVPRLKDDIFHAIRLFFLYLAHSQSMLMIHSASMLYRNKIWLFSAPSGTGKSTHVDLWNELYDTPVINGDLNLLAIENGIPVVKGTPWCGTSGISDTSTYILGGITLLKQASEDSVEELSSDQKRLLVFQRLISPAWNSDQIAFSITMIDRLAEDILICRLHCTKDENAAVTMKERIDDFINDGI